MFGAEPRLQIHFGPTESLENASSGCKCQRQFIYFLLSTGDPAKPLDTTGGTLRFRGTPVEKHRLMQCFRFRHTFCFQCVHSIVVVCGYLWNVVQNILTWLLFILSFNCMVLESTVYVCRTAVRTKIQHQCTASFCRSQFYEIHFLRSLWFTDLWHYETGFTV